MILLYRYTGSFIGAGTVTIPTPTLWMEYAASSTAGTLVHPLIGGGIAVTHRPAAKRRVRLRLLYPSETDARTCVREHSRPGLFHIEHDGRATMRMDYAVVGEITLTLDPETADVWIVEIEAQEVLG